MKKVMLMADASRRFGREFILGVQKYISIHQDWDVCFPAPQYLSGKQLASQAWFQINQADGIIDGDSHYSEQIQELNVPKIVFNTKKEIVPNASNIYTNCDEIGRIASEYFINLGYKNFAYCGFKNLPWSRKRSTAFVAYNKTNGIENTFKYDTFMKKSRKIKAERLNISKWIKTLPKPVCIFVCNDDRGLKVLEACMIIGIKVPEEVAVL